MKEELFSSVEQFYNTVSKDYNKFVHRAVPRYPEMLWAIFQYVPKDLKPKRILELGCGTGRITLPIAEAGIRAVGLDLSDDMLEIARQKLSRMPQEVRAEIKFVEGNMADFTLEQQFSLVILPNNQFRELLTTKEQENCLRYVSRNLKQDGSVIIEIGNPFRSIQHWTVGKVFRRKVGYCQETGTIVECMFETTAVNLMEQWIE